jgi:predicted ATPase
MQNAAGNLAAANGQQLNQVLGMEAEQVKGMANLSNDLALLRSSRLSAQAENQMKAGTQNLLATLGGGPESEAKKKKLLEEAMKTQQTTGAGTSAATNAAGTAVLGALGQ